MDQDHDYLNIYGVVIDAAYPIQQGAKGKWLVTLKVVDGTLHPLGNERRVNVSEDDVEFAVVIIYASRFEDCPIVRQIGDIIRVHKSTLKLKANRNNGKITRQFHCNV